MPNHLANETSPYLLQHAENPVDWFPWGEEALQKAKFLLRYHRTTGNPQALKMVTQTLEAMARGGMYDQLGGGFHRYSNESVGLGARPTSHRPPA